MAGPTDPTTTTTGTPVQIAAPSQADLDAWNQYNQQTATADTSLTNLNFTGNLTSRAFGAIDEVLGKVGTKLENIGSMTGTQATKFGLLTTATLGAQKSFESLAGVDTGRLNTFNEQLDTLLNTIKQAPGTKMASDLLEQWGNRMKHAGFNATVVEKAVRELGSGVKDTAKAILTSADNTLRLQNSFIQLTAQMGDSNTLFSEMGSGIAGIGDDLSNLNNVTSKYGDVLTNSMIATNTKSIDVMEQFASQINKLPGGFKELMTGMELGGRQTNLLTASVQFATGAGRQFADVIQDMKQAMLEYGSSGEEALKFTANITEVANTFHAQVEDVRTALMGSAEAFKFFALGEDGARQMTDGMAESMNQYVGSLKGIGVPVQNALDMFKNYTNVMKGMTQAQEAFISAQSGGPGGLRGGFQIDAMIKRGDFAGLQKKVEDTIKKMTGPIVSFDDAQKSESAAAQYTRQIQILQQGPLGSMARTRAEAESLLEAMKKGQGVAALKPDKALGDSIEKGTKIEQLSLTELHNINTNIMKLQTQAGVANLTTLQNSMAGRTGSGGGIGGTGTGINVAGQERLRAVQERGAFPGEGSPIEKTLKETSSTIKNLPNALSAIGGSLKENVMGAPTGFTSIEDYAPAGKQLGKNIPRTTTTGTATQHTGTLGTTTATTGGAHTGQPIPVVLASGSAISVNFTGVCPHCGKDVHTTEVARTVSPQSLSGPGF